MITRTNLILGGIITLFIIVAYFDKCVCNKPKVVIIPSSDSLQYYKDILGQEVASKQDREETFSKINAGYKDSIAKLANSKAKLLNEIVILKQHGSVIIEDTLSPEIVYVHDTIPGKCKVVQSATKDFANKYYKANAFISLAGKPSKLILQTFDTLKIVTKTVKEGNIFNRETYLQIDATNSNPYNKITGLNVYRKELPKPKKVGIGIQSGFGFSNSIKPSLYVGVGVSYNIIRL